jgi:hypothetical protein
MVAALLNSPVSVSKEVASIIKNLKDDFSARNDRQPNIDELRQINVSAYALSKTS